MSLNVIRRILKMDYLAETQYQSMLRAYDRLSELATNIGNSVDIGDPSAMDAARQFFFEAFHLKDWLKKDSRIANPGEVGKFVNQSSSLRLIAILCNSFKHAGTGDPEKSAHQLNKINMAYTLDLPLGLGSATLKMSKNPADGDTITVSVSKRDGPPRASAILFVTIGGNKYSALDLATKSIAEWERFLNQQNLSFSPR